MRLTRIALVALAVVALSLAACGSGDDDDVDQSSSATTTVDPFTMPCEELLGEKVPAEPVGCHLETDEGAQIDEMSEAHECVDGPDLVYLGQAGWRLSGRVGETFESDPGDVPAGPAWDACQPDRPPAGDPAD